jgi:hypothetical protein
MDCKTRCRIFVRRHGHTIHKSASKFVHRFIFEALYVSSDVIIYCTDSPFQPELLNAAAQVTFMYSFVGLLIASFLLRQSARHLANIGWITLFGIVFIQMLTPRL